MEKIARCLTRKMEAKTLSDTLSDVEAEALVLLLA